MMLGLKCLIIKVRQFRQMIEEDPFDKNVPTGLEMLTALQKMLMITAPETRKTVTECPKNLRQCTCHMKKGHENISRPPLKLNHLVGWGSKS